jgi:hypothetical protein
MKFTVDIPEEKVSFFLNLLENLNFSPIQENDTNSIPEWQKDTVRRRIYELDSGGEEVENWEDVKREIFSYKSTKQ